MGIKSTELPEPEPTTTEVTNFAAIAGRWQFSEAKATYLGLDETSGRGPIGLALTDQRFRSGHVQMSVKLSRNERTTAGIVFGYQSQSAPYWVAQIGAYGRAYAISEFRPGSGWTGVADAGSLTNIPVDKEQRISLQVAGQRVTFSVNDVQVIDVALRASVDGSGMGLFAWDDAQIEYWSIRVTAKPLRLFVVMPFTEPFDTLYKEVIAPVAQGMKFHVLRVDEIPGPGIILEDIQRQITASNVVVAEISTPNPNVFYELGYAHALEKPAVLLVRRSDSGEMPFDVRGYRAIFYDDTIGGKRLVEQKLREHLAAVARDS